MAIQFSNNPIPVVRKGELLYENNNNSSWSQTVSPSSVVATEQILAALANANNITATSTTAPAVAATTAPVVAATGTGTTSTTDNPFMDWLGLSSTPTADMIPGISNWLLVAGGLGIAIWAFMAESHG